MILYLYSHLKMWNKQPRYMKIHIKEQKYILKLQCAWNVINMCNFYVTDSEIYCNTRIHDILKIHD